MAELRGELVSQIEIKSDADAFYDVFSMIPGLTPTNIKDCTLGRGKWGAMGSILQWNYLQDGKCKVAVTTTDLTILSNKSMISSVIEGGLQELYQNFITTLCVDNNLVTRTFKYNKVSESVPDPETLMDFIRKVTIDIDANLGKFNHHVLHKVSL